MKRFADDYGITVLLIHYTRKIADIDVLNTVPRANAITGAAGFTWVLTKNRRSSADATLSIAGRDVEQCEFHLAFVGHR